MKRNEVKNVMANLHLMEAWSRGEVIEFLDDARTNQWVELKNFGSFSKDPKFYRIKPKAPPLHDCNAKVWIICRHDDGEVFNRKTKKSAMKLYHQQVKAGFKVTIDCLSKTVKYNGN